MSGQLKFSWQPELHNPCMVIGWSLDAGKLGARTTDYLNKKLGGRSFYEIEPVEFFPLGGVTIENNLLQFPESKFYVCPEKNLVVFKSDPPSSEWYKFLNLILDTAETYLHAQELYTIGGMVTLGAHTNPRELLGTFNSPELKKALSNYKLSMGLDYETPPGQRPTLNSFLLWAAMRRKIPGISLWVPVPFYLVAVDDPRAELRILEFLNQRFDLGIDLSDLEEESRRQYQMIAELRNGSSDIDEYIKRLESNQSLSAEENQKLVQEVEKFLRTEKG